MLKKKRKRKRVEGKIAGGIGVPLPTDPYHDSSTEVKLLFFFLLNSPAPLKSCFPDPVYKYVYNKCCGYFLLVAVSLTKLSFFFPAGWGRPTGASLISL